MRAYDVVHTVQDLRHLVWSETGQTSASGGTFLKARTGVGPSATYYKLSCYDSYRGIYGHECVNEIVASRLMEALGVEHVRYSLVHARIVVDDVEHVTWLARSKSFRKAGESKMAFDTFFDLMHEKGESQLEFCERFGWLESVQRMMLVDFLIANRDRHGANIEVLRARDGSLRLAPLFDNGVSLVFSCYGDEQRARSFEPLQDVRANNFIGTKSLEHNLQFVPSSVDVGTLCKGDRQRLLAGLDDALPQAHLDAIWSIIWQRWLHWQQRCSARDAEAGSLRNANTGKRRSAEAERQRDARDGKRHA